tara:strand:+ start:275 stop:391 length:117 start_codon:yes stop_codon:yes gene_type:complete
MIYNFLSGCFIMMVSLLYEEGSGSDANIFQSGFFEKGA